MNKKCVQYISNAFDCPFRGKCHVDGERYVEWYQCWKLTDKNGNRPECKCDECSPFPKFCPLEDVE